MVRLVAPERSGWRDADLSERHREWGFDCPAVDVDFFMVEYNHGKPVALVDYKHHLAREVDSNHPSFRAMVHLANSASIPCWIARYWPDYWTFVVTPLNDRAISLFRKYAELPITEQDYVLLLYAIRSIVVEREVVSSLNIEISPDIEPRVVPRRRAQ